MPVTEKVKVTVLMPADLADAVKARALSEKTSISEFVSEGMAVKLGVRPPWLRIRPRARREPAPAGR